MKVCPNRNGLKLLIPHLIANSSLSMVDALLSQALNEWELYAITLLSPFCFWQRPAPIPVPLASTNNSNFFACDEKSGKANSTESFIRLFNSSNDLVLSVVHSIKSFLFPPVSTLRGCLLYTSDAADERS